HCLKGGYLLIQPKAWMKDVLYHKYVQKNQNHLGISKEVGTPRYLSLVVPLTKVGDEAVHKELGDSSGPRCQDTILGDVDAQTRFEITSKQSNDPPLSRGYTLGSGEDKSRIRRDLHLDDAEGTDCLPTATIFEELARMGAKSTTWNEFSCSMASLIICLATNQKFNLSKYIFDAMVKHLDGGVKFLRITAQRQEAEVPQDEAEHEESVSTRSNDPQPSGDDSMQLTDLMILCTKLQTQVLDLQKAKDAQAKEIAALKKRIQRLERRKMSRPTGLKRLSKVGMSRRVESSEDQESLGAPEDASKQGRSIEDIDADVDVSLVDETQERQNDDLMFDSGVLEDDVMHVEAKVDGKDEQSTKPDDSTAGEAVTTASVDDSVVPTTIEEITLAQTLIQIKAAKPKVVTTAATTATTTRPKDRGVVVQEPSEFRVPQETQPSSSKDKGKGIMIEPEVPLKRKDQIALDEQIARDIQAKLDAELLEEQKLARKQEEEANIALIESWENTQAMMEADRLLAERLQSKEREELTDEEKAKLFMELMEKRRKHFAALRAQEKRNRPPTKAQKRTQMSTYLKHMGGYTYKQLKGKSFDEIQKLFDKEIKRVNTFVAMGSEVQERKENKEEGREETTKGSRKKMLGRKRAGKEQQKESSKKQKVEEEKESEEVDEINEAELKKLLVIKKNEDIAIYAIPLATKLPVIIDYKLHKEGMLVHYQLIRADGSSKRYSSMIRMLQGIDREDLKALWRIVKAKVTIWKLIDSSGVPLRNLKIQKMNIKFRGGLLGLKRLHGFLEVTAAQVHNGNYAKCHVAEKRSDQVSGFVFIAAVDNGLMVMVGCLFVGLKNRMQGFCIRHGSFLDEEGEYKERSDSMFMREMEKDIRVCGVQKLGLYECTKALALSPMMLTMHCHKLVLLAVVLMLPVISLLLHRTLASKIHEDDLEECDLKSATLCTKLFRLVELKCDHRAQGYEAKFLTNMALMKFLDSEFEKVKQEKDGIDFKIKKFDKALKDLDQLLGSQITDKSKKGLGYSAVPPPHPLIYNRPNKLDLSYSGLDEFKEPEFKGLTLVSYDEEQDESKPKSKKKTVIPTAVKIEFVKPQNHEKPAKKSVRCAKMYRSQSPRENQKNWNGQKSNQLGKDFVMYNKACYICGSFNHLQINCHNHQRRDIVSRNNYNRVDAKSTHPNVLRNMSPKGVLMKTSLTPVNTVRPVNTAHPKTTVHSAKSKTHFSKQAQSTAKRPFYKQTTLTRRSMHEAKRHYYTGRHYAVNTARSYSGQVNVVRVKGVNAVKSSAYWVWRPTKSNGASLAFKRHNYIDAQGRSNGCSRHMTSNIACLSDFKQFDGGYVAFGGGAYGGKITSKGTLKTDNLDFEDLPDENHILLKIPRKDNMYSFDIKNIVPKESLICLVAKATLDESML
ncbi:hypothetical protein Tco_0196133, partial [Tanacetum coccineum]